ncbi:TonB-dependent receptor plug domain-containing protein [Thalassotalea euphylliae]|uniref:TonB-dependent receptor n=1 Tax=Thalassotalea euphylliae TaxID=1655234 RepID=A0A3E0UKD8_9GAMM|nr:TonB-dependent receptor [Thalassotalea euphylliae]REL37389.1 TonB-dependent receptor [Thalassotalea euphylliae]
MTKFFSKKTSLALSISAALLASQSFNAVAEEANEEIERIQITGSHIKRTSMEGPSPITSLSSDDIQKTGVTDLISLFTKLPISGQGTFSTQANSSDDTANGGSSVSLRGLGADSTLILVNGRRVSVSPFAKGIDTAFVDINNIPLSAIKRVDILKDGASATYGSDAVAGVINVVLRDDVDGVELSGKVGTTADGGGDEQSFSLVFGNQTEKSSHTFILEYFDREEVLYADRDYSRSANQAALTGDPLATDFRSSSGIPGTIALASDPSNRLIDLFGNDICPVEDQDPENNLCRYDYAPHMTMIPDAERFSWNYMGKYEINDTVRAFAELNGQNSKSIVRGAGSPSFNELFMSGDNPNHPFADMPDHPFYQQDLTMRRRTVDIGNREKRVDSDYYRAILGLQGEVNDWSWELAYSYIKSESTERGVDGFPNSRRIQEAIDGVQLDDGTTLYWNPFEPSANSQESLDYIETTTVRVGKSTNRSIDFKISGPVLEMEHGDLLLALGAEYREESIADNPDDQFLRGDIFGTEATQANGSRDNTAIFGELAIPVLDTLEVQLAVRYEDYSDFGTTTDPKVSFLWAPSDDLSVRGSYGTAFRAPSLHQLGLGRTDESPNLVDTQRCALIGDQDRACDPQEYTAVFEGNPDLGPEESESYNFGVIYNVTDDLSFSIDYYNYDIEDIIDSDTQFVMDNFGLDPNIVERRPTSIPGDPGEVIQVNDSFQNIGDLETSGLDIDIRYNLETEYGQFRFGYIMNYVTKFEDFRGTEEGGFEQPEVRWTTSVDWLKDDFSATVAVNYIGEFDQEASLNIDKKVDSMTTVDATINYYGIEDTVLTLGATNLFNEEPPFAYHDFMGFVVNVHNGQGRFAYAQATYKF